MRRMEQTVMELILPSDGQPRRKNDLRNYWEVVARKIDRARRR